MTTKAQRRKNYARRIQRVVRRIVNASDIHPIALRTNGKWTIITPAAIEAMAFELYTVPARDRSPTRRGKSRAKQERK